MTRIIQMIDIQKHLFFVLVIIFDVSSILNQKVESCPSLTKFTSMAGLFSKIVCSADKELAMKLLKERCGECFIFAMYFSSSLTVSIKLFF